MVNKIQENSYSVDYKYTKSPNSRVWLKAAILFNMGTTVAALSVIVLTAMLSGVSKNYDSLVDSTEKTQEQVKELRQSFSNNAKTIHAIYVADSTKKANIKRNTKLLLKSNPIILDTPVYVNINKYNFR